MRDRELTSPKRVDGGHRIVGKQPFQDGPPDQAGGRRRAPLFSPPSRWESLPFHSFDRKKVVRRRVTPGGESHPVIFRGSTAGVWRIAGLAFDVWVGELKGL